MCQLETGEREANKWSIPRRLLSVAVMLVSLGAISGCEVDSFFDQTVVGRWEHTPAILPILDRIEVIEPEEDGLNATNVRAEDLIPDVSEYVIGPGDLITVTVFELIQPGVDTIITRRVDETGRVRLQTVGGVQAAGLSASQLEQEVSRILERKGILRDATVSVVVQQSQQNTFSIVGEPGAGGIGTYIIPKPDFRLMDALALAGGVPERTRFLRVIRPTALTPEVAGDMPAVEGGPAQSGPAQQAPQDPTQLIEQLMQGIDEDQVVSPGQPGPAGEQAPESVAGGIGDTQQDGGQWVFIAGQWVRVGVGGQADGEDDGDGRRELMTQRIIEVPYDKLIDGDMSYNMVVRPGDMIRLPGATGGFVYLMGQIARPGAFTVPGENDLTFMQLFASAGGLTPTAWPSRVDLIRRVGPDQYAMVRLDITKIFEGVQPDFYIKPNDIINVGSSFVTYPLAILRNGLRISYGIGFVYDRNFFEDDDN